MIVRHSHRMIAKNYCGAHVPARVHSSVEQRAKVILWCIKLLVSMFISSMATSVIFLVASRAPPIAVREFVDDVWRVLLHALSAVIACRPRLHVYL